MNVKSVIKRMGNKWVLHPDNFVKRLEVPLRDSVGTNLAETFKRVREQMASANAAEVKEKVTKISKGAK